MLAPPVVPSFMTLTVAMVLSWGGMLAHNMYELPIAVLDVENTGPLVVAAGLVVAYASRPHARAVHLVLLGWGLLNFLIGGVLTVLPLQALPFEPEQSASHYLVHFVYALGQLPLILLAVRMVRAWSSTDGARDHA